MLVAHPAPNPDRANFHGHGSTNEHADLLQELAPWATHILSEGASELRISESTIPPSQPDYALTVIVFAPAEHMPALTRTYALAYTDNPTSKALRGTGLTPTGHHLVLVKDT
ncbi:hypothetical protein [Nocardiopsis dassonvillei]|uniref:hypothetical protein n=1 Tax=Nocardiopsis dassonvillei TaxID=2014 RepID=UPI003407EA9D